MNRRHFLRLWPAAALAQTPGAGVKTYTFKTVGECRIQADVHGAATGGARRPALVWIHGGALITGTRRLPERPVRPSLPHMFVEAGYVVVSIDYRLAPETKLPAIIEDVQDAWKWVRQKGPDLFGIDPDRMAVAGGSAGGYLALMTGFAVEPRPKALVSLYGYGDITGAWYSRPDPFYRTQPLVSKEDAYGAVGSKEISDGTSGNRGRFYLYCRQNGLWPKEAAGHDPDAQPRWFDRYCPIRNVTGKYPPAVLIHGDKDTDVPYEQSVMMAKELGRGGVQHRFITIPGGGHGFGNSDPAVVRQAYETALAFAGLS